jgi:hypothetical protein
MNKKYVLINSEKISLSRWLKWLMLISISYLCLLIISLAENLISNLMNINIANIIIVTFYVRGFIVLSLIHDLAPKFRKTISIIWIALASFIYIGVDAKAGDRLYLGTLLFIIAISTYNTFLYKKVSNLKSKKDISQ